MMIFRLRSLPIIFTTMIGCSGGSHTIPDSTLAATTDTASVFRDRGQELERAAKELVGFLRDDVAFETIRLADTVVLYLSPEGGGTRTAFSRDQLRRPSQWVLRSGRQTYAFVPSPSLKKMTAKSGSHFKCLEYQLASLFPELAELPHVGVKLEPDSAGSCLESWNATFVFEESAQPPRLVAAVYDQWEW
jgi:hypothetical protein